MELAREHESMLMIADYHALTTIKNPVQLQANIMDAARDYLAAGIEPKKVIVFKQSDVPEHMELAWIFQCLVSVSFLEMAHAYKDKLAQGLEANAGLFAYPMLMAADILLYDTDVVPVGTDQRQHVEYAREAASKFNNAFGATFKEPKERILRDVAIVPGTDGRKMSKSYGNTIPLFADEKAVKKAIMGIVTDSKGVEEPKDPKECIVYQIHSLLLDESGKKELAKKYQAGGLGYGDAKKMLFEAFMDYFRPMRERRALLKDAEVIAVITEGSKRAKNIAEQTMERVRQAVGLR